MKNRFNGWNLLGWIVLVLVIIGIPFLVQSLMTGTFASTGGGSNDGWLGFWGGYLGAAITVLGVYIQLRIQFGDKKRDFRPELYFSYRFYVEKGMLLTLKREDVTKNNDKKDDGEKDKDGTVPPASKFFEDVNEYKYMADTNLVNPLLCIENLAMHKFVKTLINVDYVVDADSKSRTINYAVSSISTDTPVIIALPFENYKLSKVTVVGDTLAGEKLSYSFNIVGNGDTNLQNIAIKDKKVSDILDQLRTERDGMTLTTKVFGNSGINEISNSDITTTVEPIKNY
ncbi:hypothetical protein [Levilactobacillus zymae]|uniref:hypothetical protein n=1 Tax=Levilactobacillus zymae TaxID=267363 RepID=UPI0028B84398|nr:hypothetical protein [Levilactobacillus zymae]MDT6980181.1 hypothetical protein [Levilactobacillus zymae]